MRVIRQLLRSGQVTSACCNSPQANTARRNDCASTASEASAVKPMSSQMIVVIASNLCVPLGGQPVDKQRKLNGLTHGNPPRSRLCSLYVPSCQPINCTADMT